MRPFLPDGVKFITERLRSFGKEAYIVGGCVRDFLLSKEPFDYDVTTNALPSEMKEIFSDIKTVETGIKHGTLTVLSDGIPYEVTTYRIDGEYEDHRHPKSVEFTSEISGDLSRRDFTMNAIAYSEKDGFIDLFGGMADIENQVIRAVGDPMRRFEEDALRILRAIRFASVLGFSVEAETARCAALQAPLLSSVSRERIYTEWTKLLGGESAYEVITEYGSIISEFLFREKILLPKREAFLAASRDLRQLSLFALSLSSPAERFSEFCDRMKTDAKTKKLGVSVLSCLGQPTETVIDRRRIMIKLGKEAAVLLFKLKNLISSGGEVKEEFFESELSYSPLSLGELQVSGEDMKALGYTGRQIGDMLLKLLYMCAEGRAKNEREALIRAARKG